MGAILNYTCPPWRLAKNMLHEGEARKGWNGCSCRPGGAKREQRLLRAEQINRRWLRRMAAQIEPLALLTCPGSGRTGNAPADVAIPQLDRCGHRPLPCRAGSMPNSRHR